MYKFYKCSGCGDVLIGGKEGAISLTVVCECPPETEIRSINPNSKEHLGLTKWAEKLMSEGEIDREKVLKV